ncbi:MAG: hypothetical protein LC808_05640, partial [Actinobacteria bacterium]|nr:hypothetical protein [Actinomycetota bacterium]
LFHLACARLYELRLVRPGLTVIEQSLVGAAREAARQETARRVAPLSPPSGAGASTGSWRSTPTARRPRRRGCATSR